MRLGIKAAAPPDGHAVAAAGAPPELTPEVRAALPLLYLRPSDKRRSSTPMSLAVAIQMDPIESDQHRRRQHLRAGAGGAGARPRAVPLPAAHLSFRERPAVAPRPARSRCGASTGNHVTLRRAERRSTSPTMDVVLMRQDPPFDMAYITATHLLEHIHPRDPGGQRPGRCPQRAREAVRHPLPGADAADADHLRPRRRSWPSAPSTATSSSSRCSAMAAPACSTSARTTRT